MISCCRVPVCTICFDASMAHHLLAFRDGVRDRLRRTPAGGHRVERDRLVPVIGQQSRRIDLAIVEDPAVVVVRGVAPAISAACRRRGSDVADGDEVAPGAVSTRPPARDLPPVPITPMRTGRSPLCAGADDGRQSRVPGGGRNARRCNSCVLQLRRMVAPGLPVGLLRATLGGGSIFRKASNAARSVTSASRRMLVLDLSSPSARRRQDACRSWTYSCAAATSGTCSCGTPRSPATRARTASSSGMIVRSIS